MSDVVLEQSVPGASVQTTATVLASDQFGGPVQPARLRLRVVDTADETEVVVALSLVFDERGQAQSVLTLTPPRGRDQHLRVEVIGVDSKVIANTTTLTLIALEVLDSLTIAVHSLTQTQRMPGREVFFEVTVTAGGSKGTQPWHPPEPLRLLLQHTAAPGVTVVLRSSLIFRNEAASLGVSGHIVSALPLPGINTSIIFEIAGDPNDLAGVRTNRLTIDVIAADVLSTVTLTVSGERMRTVQSEQESVTIEVQLMTEYLGENMPEQTPLQLRAVATNGVEVSPPVVAVAVPAGGGSASANFVLTLGTTRQTTVSFEVADLPTGVSFDSPQIQVERLLVSLELSVTPRFIEDLEPRREAVAEFRVRAEIRSTDGRPVGGLSQVIVHTTVTEVTAGQVSDVRVAASGIVESEPGVYESTVMVMIAAGRVSTASVEITVDGAGLASAATVVQLARELILGRLELSLSDVVLEQSAPGASVQTMATVLASDQFGGPVRPAGLLLIVVNAATESEVAVTPPLVFDAGGRAQSVLTLTPPRDRDQHLRVVVIGVAGLGVIANTTTLTLIALEVLDSLTLDVLSSTLMQRMLAAWCNLR